MDTIAVVGNGVVGTRVVRRLRGTKPSRRIVSVDGRETSLATLPLLDSVTVAVLAHGGRHREVAVALMRRGISVISVGDDLDDVAEMMSLDVPDGVSLVIGAGMSPGLTGLIARHLAASLAVVDEIHIALHGTAGPACARQHHRALAGTALTFDDGRMVASRAGTGKQLAWFPEPVGAYDCYRAEVPGPRVLHEVFPSASRVTVRVSANRRDRLTSRLPMLTRPHAEGGVGAVRVELRGALATGARETVIAGVAEMVGTATSATAAAYATLAIEGRLRDGLVLPGDQRDDTMELLCSIERFGVRLQEFTGVPNA
jgi:hypothetical protein